MLEARRPRPEPNLVYRVPNKAEVTASGWHSAAAQPAGWCTTGFPRAVRGKAESRPEKPPGCCPGGVA